MNSNISVVIPIHNKAAHLARSVNSALAQEPPVAEIILVDDASTDESFAIASSFQDARIKLLRREVPGPGGYAARNMGIQSATSEWIAFLDADDEWYPGYIAEIEKLISENEETACVFTGWEWAWPSGRKSQDFYSSGIGAKGGTLDFERFLSIWLGKKECPIWTSASVFRRHALISAGLFPADRCRRGGDKDTWLRVMAGGSAASSPSVLVAYHQEGGNQVTKTTSTNKRHCLCPTLEISINNVSPRIGRMLKRLFNQETFAYARLVAFREPIDPQMFAGFYVSVNPLKYAALVAMSALPRTFISQIRSLIMLAKRTAAPV